MKKLIIYFLLISLFLSDIVFSQTTTTSTPEEGGSQIVTTSTSTPQLEKIKERLEKVKKNIAKIKNKTKRTIAEKIYLRINELNQKLTDHYLNVLDQLQKVLVGITERADRSASRGIDVSLAREKINLAQEAIDKAKEEVQKQKDKIYELPQVSTETKLKSAVGNIRKQFHSDIKAVEAMVKEARDITHKAVTTLVQNIKGITTTTTTTTEETSTTTTTTTPTTTNSQ